MTLPFLGSFFLFVSTSPPDVRVVASPSKTSGAVAAWASPIRTTKGRGS
jgi:hypothetical protein